VSSTIDVLLPYYGDVELLKKAVLSVKAQTYSDWKLLVLDDGYPDPEPSTWLRSLAESDPRIVYMRNETNLGANGNYRRALTMASSEMFVMMGADDIMLPNYLGVIADAAERHRGIDVFQPGVEVIDEKDRVYRPLTDRVKRWYAPRVDGYLILQGQQMAVSLSRADWAYFPSIAWRTATVQRIGFREGLDVVQDLALMLDICTSGGSMLVIDERAFRYRRHAGSDSSIRALDGRRFAEERRFFLAEAECFAKLGWAKAARVARLHLSSRLHALTVMGTALLRGHAKSAVRLAPYVFGR
jgi:glycosyltransferase involved in cell wall biosynthesis